MRGSAIARTGRIAAAFLLLLAAGAGAEAQTATNQTAMKMTLDWRIEGPAALFLHGLDKGYFREEGVDLVIEPGTGSRDSIARVMTGGYDVGFGDMTTAIRLRDEQPAVDLKAVMMIYDRPPFAIVGRRSRGVTPDPKSLAGKRLGAPAADGAFAQWPIFKSIAKIDDSAIRLENVGFPVREPMLAAGEVDAVFGFAHSAFISLRARGVPQDDIVVMLMANHGLELYGNAIFVNPKLLADKPEVVRGFLRALMRSMKEVVADPDSAIDSVLKRMEGGRRDIETERLRAVVDQNVATPWARTNGFGGIDRARWERAADQIGLAVGFKNKTRSADAFTEAFLPPLADRQFAAGN
jgi:NitT/TauT family transport system substrate-binding protein